MTKKQLIIFIYSGFTKLGGRENWIRNITPGLIERGYEVTVICFSPPNEDAFRFTSGQTKVTQLKTLRRIIPNFLLWAKASLGLLILADMIFFIIQSCRIARYFLMIHEGPVYFLVTSTVVEGFIAWYIRQRLNFDRVIVSVRGKAPLEMTQLFPYLKPLWYFIEKKVLSEVPYIWANGYDTAEYIRDVGAESIVIPNGVDFDSFCKQLPRKNGLHFKSNEPEAPLIVMSIATLRPIKGIPQLIEVVPMIAKNNKNFKVVFVGTGEPHRFIKRLIVDGCQEYVEFPGPIPSIEVIHEADIVTCISGGSGMSMSALEAMAAGKAIVAWDSAVYRQLLSHEHSAILVQENNVQELSTAIITLLNDELLRKKIGVNAQNIAKQYDWQVVCDKIDCALQSIK